VIVSLVTAETQSRAYGGDLQGEGGHFHVVLPVTPEWQTVELPWSRFAAPNWGATVGLRSPALTKLQGFDWLVTDQAKRFEVDLDDIELY
jgi:hypothetical protein